jgi:hypothetical protein
MLIDFAGKVVVTRQPPRRRMAGLGFGDGDLQATLGMCLNINSSGILAAIQFWHNRELTKVAMWAVSSGIGSMRLGRDVRLSNSRRVAGSTAAGTA